MRSPLRGRGAVALALVAAALALGSCGGDTTEAHVVLSIEPAEPAMGMAEVTVTITDEAGAPVRADSVIIVGKMEHPMEPSVAEASPAGDGVFVADFEFTMPGEWVLTVTAEGADAGHVTEAFQVSVDPPPERESQD